jgi:low affinity Fe/Cu permease
MKWTLFNPFQKTFIVLAITIIISQAVVLFSLNYTQKKINLSCPKIKIPKPVEAQHIDLTPIIRLDKKVDLLIKQNSKMDKILIEQRKVDKILKTMDSWGIDP